MDSAGHSLAPAAASGSVGALIVALSQHLLKPTPLPSFDLRCSETVCNLGSVGPRIRCTKFLNEHPGSPEAN